MAAEKVVFFEFPVSLINEYKERKLRKHVKHNMHTNEKMGTMVAGQQVLWFVLENVCFLDAKISFPRKAGFPENREASHSQNTTSS